MDPTIQTNKFKLYQKQVRDIEDFQRGDLLLYYHYTGKFDGDTMDALIGRVIGLPGDRIRMENGTLFRNGNEVPEPYIDKKGSASISLVVVPKDHIYVLADNRPKRNRDSRYFGPIPDYCLLGKVEK